MLIKRKIKGRKGKKMSYKKLPINIPVVGTIMATKDVHGLIPKNL